jgi:hypothetical protein
MKRIKSIIEGRDNVVLKSLFDFYWHPEGKIVDLTCNKKRMWKGLPQENVIFCDIDPSYKPDIVCDFKNTPFADSEVAVIVFDPPHLPLAASSPKSMQRFAKDYGLDKSIKADNVNGFFEPFLVEANRILQNEGLIFIKLSDFVHNHKYQWSLVYFINAVNKIDGLTATDLIIKKDPSAGNLISGRWKNSHHARRSHCWWIIVRKGGCEPKFYRPKNW